MLDYFKDHFHFLSARDFLDAEYMDESYYQPGWHYGPEIHSRIAEAVAAVLLACMDDGSCEFARLRDISGIKRED